MKSSIERIRMRAVFLGFFLREDAGNSQHHWPGKGSHKKKKDLNGEEELNYTRRRIGLVLLGWVLAFSERMLGIPRTLQTRTSRPKRKRRRPAAKVSQPDGRWAGGHYSRRCWLPPPPFFAVTVPLSCSLPRGKEILIGCEAALKYDGGRAVQKSQREKKRHPREKKQPPYLQHDPFLPFFLIMRLWFCAVFTVFFCCDMGSSGSKWVSPVQDLYRRLNSIVDIRKKTWVFVTSIRFLWVHWVRPFFTHLIHGILRGNSCILSENMVRPRSSNLAKTWAR